MNCPNCCTRIESTAGICYHCESEKLKSGCPLDAATCSRFNDTPETNSQLGSHANSPDDTAMWLEIGLPRKIERERNQLRGYLCRIKLPLPIKFVAALADLFPGKNIRMKDEGGYLCIFTENAGSDARRDGSPNQQGG